MNTYNTYDHIVAGYSIPSGDIEVKEQALIDVINGIVWSELHQQENTIKYAESVLDHDGISAYYDYGADYYFFTDSEE